MSEKKCYWDIKLDVRPHSKPTSISPRGKLSKINWKVFRWLNCITCDVLLWVLQYCNKISHSPAQVVESRILWIITSNEDIIQVRTFVIFVSSHSSHSMKQNGRWSNTNSVIYTCLIAWPPGILALFVPCLPQSEKLLKRNVRSLDERKYFLYLPSTR